jgi:hypothetical protein
LLLVNYPDQENIESTATYMSIDIELWQNDRYTSAFPLYHLPGIARVVIEEGQLALLRLSRSH